MQTPKTSLIIPTYLTSQKLTEMTNACIASLKYGYPDEVIVVDDGSPSKFFVKSSPFVNYYLVNKQNGGYASAVNQGLRHAQGKVIIISNNDIVFVPGWLPALLKPLEEGYDISSVRTSDNGYEMEDKITEGDKFGSLWAMKRAVYKKLGGLDESFGNYFEDLDYRRRALNAGFRVGKNHAFVVEHLGKATFEEIDPEDANYHQAMKIYEQKWGLVE